MSRSAGQIAAITAATALTGLVGYAVYFDYMRRNSTEFRKGISTSWSSSTGGQAGKEKRAELEGEGARAGGDGSI